MQSTELNPSAYPALRHGWYALSVLVVAYIFSFIDRTILTLMVDPIRRSLQISDVQVSLLHGLAFAIFYTGLGIPIARLADRRNRVTIITCGIVVWSAMTAVCGLTKSFGQLFLARIGVGAGEAALSPAAYSILADYFPSARLTQILSIYTASAYIGGGLALIVGGGLIALVPPVTLPLVGYVEPWQMAFFVVGLPGLAVALVMRTVREPPRLGLAAGRKSGEAVPIREVLAHVGGRRGAYGFLIAAAVAHSMMWNGAVSWVPTYFIRTFGLSPATVGLWSGLVMAVGGGGGIIAGGSLAVWLRRRGHDDANHLMLIGANLSALAFGCIMTQIDNPGWGFVCYFCFMFTCCSPVGGIIASLQEISPNQMRAQVSAVYQLGVNLAGIGCGPTLVALMSQHVFGGDLGLRHAVSVIVLVGAPTAALMAWLARPCHRRAVAAG